jgi:hypothetical protein
MKRLHRNEAVWALRKIIGLAPGLRPYLEGLPPRQAWERYQRVEGTECQNEYIIQQLHQGLDM